MNTFDIGKIESVERKTRSDAVLCNLPSDKMELIILGLGQYSYRDAQVNPVAAFWRKPFSSKPISNNSKHQFTATQQTPCQSQ